MKETIQVLRKFQRYPGPMEPVTEDEYKEALKIAELVVSWVEDLIMPDAEGTAEN